MAGATTNGASKKDPTLEADIKDFLKKHKLDAQAEEILRSLRPEDARKSVNTFKPPEEVQNPSAAFLSFQRRRTPAPVEALRAALARGAPSSDEVLRFLEKFDLNGRSLEVLRSYSAATQGHLLSSFAPPSDVRNMTGFFVSYASRAAEREKRDAARGKAPAVTPVGAIPNAGSETGLPKPPGLELEASEVLTIDEFIEKFELDDSSRKLLEDLDAQTSKAVLGGFKPAPGTSDKNRRLKSYVESQLNGRKTKGTGAVGSPSAKGKGGTKSSGKVGGKGSAKGDGKGSSKSRGGARGSPEPTGGAIGSLSTLEGPPGRQGPPLRNQPVGGRGTGGKGKSSYASYGDVSQEYGKNSAIGGRAARGAGVSDGSKGWGGGKGKKGKGDGKARESSKGAQGTKAAYAKGKGSSKGSQAPKGLRRSGYDQDYGYNSYGSYDDYGYDYDYSYAEPKYWREKSGKGPGKGSAGYSTSVPRGRGGGGKSRAVQPVGWAPTGKGSKR